MSKTNSVKSYNDFVNIDMNDYQYMKTELLQAGTPSYSKGCKKDLDEHLDMLAIEFSQKPLLLFYHTWLTVMIRREIDVQENIKAFFCLWKKEHKFLIQNLSSRWLVSACDTFVDCHEDALEQSYAMSAVLFINTIKLYETEELMMFKEFGISYSKEVPNDRISLFDGISAFRIGGGDMIKNMMTRIKKLDLKENISYLILLELIDRVHLNNSVYGRMAQNHKSEHTRWYTYE